MIPKVGDVVRVYGIFVFGPLGEREHLHDGGYTKFRVADIKPKTCLPGFVRLSRRGDATQYFAHRNQLRRVRK